MYRGTWCDTLHFINQCWFFTGFPGNTKVSRREKWTVSLCFCRLWANINKTNVQFAHFKIQAEKKKCHDFSSVVTVEECWLQLVQRLLLSLAWHWYASQPLLFLIKGHRCRLLFFAMDILHSWHHKCVIVSAHYLHEHQDDTPAL